MLLKDLFRNFIASTFTFKITDPWKDFHFLQGKVQYETRSISNVGAAKRGNTTLVP